MQDNAFTNKVKVVWAFIKRVAKRVWEYLKVAKMEWIVMIAVFAFDLISKGIVESTVEYGDTVTAIPYIFNIHRIHNVAAAFGSDWFVKLLTPMGARIFFSVFAVAASVALILVLIRHKGKSKWFRVSIALFVAGAMGNCIDRMALGYVRDFIEFVYLGMTIGGRTTWSYIFNIADVALVSGVIMLVIYFLFMYKDSSKKKNNAELLTDELGDIDPEDMTATVENADGANTDTDSADVTDSDADGAPNIEPAEKESEIAKESEVIASDNVAPDTSGSQSQTGPESEGAK